MVIEASGDAVINALGVVERTDHAVEGNIAEKCRPQDVRRRVRRAVRCRCCWKRQSESTVLGPRIRRAVRWRCWMRQGEGTVLSLEELARAMGKSAYGPVVRGWA